MRNISIHLLLSVRQLLISAVAVLSVGLFTQCSLGHREADVMVIGGGASGITAGVQSARMGVKTVIIEEFEWLGGMLTSAGVSAIDGNHNLPGGLWGEFRDSLIAQYGSAENLSTGWVSHVLFEPSVGNAIWQDIAANEPDLSVVYGTVVRSVVRKNNYWEVVTAKGDKVETWRVNVLIDGTELGDIAKMCGAKYDIGMERREECQEAIAPFEANDIIQDLTYVAVLKDYGKGEDRTIAKPDNYDPSVFYCACQVPQCLNPKENQRVWDCESMLTYGKLPNNKYMINWPIEGNDFYLNIIEMTPEQRQKELEKAKNFTLCFLYYIQHELGFKHLALADDEFPTADKLPFIPYHRESRRIHGLVRFNVNHVGNPYGQPEKLYRTGIAVGDYPVDHHHARYPEWEKLPDLHFYPVPSYSLPLGALIPQGVENLIVAEKSISVSNLLNGSTRLQPVVLQIGQAAGALAAIAVKQDKTVADVAVRDVQDAVLNANGYLLPYLDLTLSDRHFKAVQRIGATGLLKGEGKNVGWSNQTWFYTDSLVATGELKEGLAELYPGVVFQLQNEWLTVGESITLASRMGEATGSTEANPVNQQTWESLGLSGFDLQRKISRKEFAVLVDALADPFHQINVDHHGLFVSK